MIAHRAGGYSQRLGYELVYQRQAGDGPFLPGLIGADELGAHGYDENRSGLEANRRLGRGWPHPAASGRRCPRRRTKPAEKRYHPGMHARKLQVKDGRLVLDEPTNLPDGAEVEVLVIDDELSAEERAELHASLDRALDDSEAGRGMDAWEYLKQYRARREARTA